MSGDKTNLSVDGLPLYTYYVYLTGGCNLACRHCWLAPTFQPHGDTGGHLDYKLFELALEEGKPLGLKHVKLTGGEPLLHPDFLRMVDLLKEKSLGLTIETNGTLLTQSLARYLKDKSTLDFISVSLDGADSETHDAFRGVAGSFEKTCQAVRYLTEVGYRPQVIMSLHAGNVDQIENLVRLAENLGAGSVKFNLIQPSGRGAQMSHRGQVLDVHRLYELGKWVENDLQKRAAIPLSYSWPMAFFNVRHLLRMQGYTCDILHVLGILPAGHLAMCGIGVEVPDLCYGRLGENPVEEVWRTNPVLQKLRDALPAKLEGVCGVCIFRARCLGLCVAENYRVSGRLTAPFWFCQMAEEAGIFPATRLRVISQDVSASRAQGV